LDLSLQITGKSIVGINSLLGQRVDLKNLEQMAKNLQNDQNIRNQLCYVTVLAEVSGREYALAELARLRTNSVTGGFKGDLRSFQQLYEYNAESLDAEQRNTIERYEWFGRLALSQGKAYSNPERKAVLNSAYRTVFATIILSMAVVTGVLTGLVLLAAAVVFWSKGRLRGQLVIPETPGPSLLEAFAIYITGFMALPALVALSAPGFLTGASILSVCLGIFAIFWPRIREANWKEYRKAIGWHRGRGFFREVGCGIAGYLAGLPLLALAAVFVLLLSKYTTGATPSHPIVNQLNRNTFHILLVLACVWAPVIEETFFRGVLFGYLRRRFSWVFSGVISAVLFALVHPQGLLGVPVIGMIGFTMSAIREWRGSLIASMSAHALNNGSALLFLIMILD
jgi:membrane protease YdiL (CAAX protease family)